MDDNFLQRLIIPNLESVNFSNTIGSEKIAGTFIKNNSTLQSISFVKFTSGIHCIFNLCCLVYDIIYKKSHILFERGTRYEKGKFLLYNIQ